MTKRNRATPQREAVTPPTFTSPRQIPCDGARGAASSSCWNGCARSRAARADALLLACAALVGAACSATEGAGAGHGGAAQASTDLAPLADASSHQTDVVLDWNAIALQNTGDAPFGLLGQARSLAIVHVAMHDALDAVTGALGSYTHPLLSEPDASKEAAVVAAAHRVLSQLHPARAAVLDSELSAALARIASGAAKVAGIALGEQIADHVLALRAEDGAATTVPYASVDRAGHWRPTPPGFLPPLAPHWGNVTPLVLARGDQFRPPPPPELGDARFARDFNEVKSVGDLNSASRPSDRADVARFFTAPGPVFYNPAARQLAEERGASLEDNARLFARLNAAMADAFIACWDAKYYYDFWRPTTAIRAADLDGNADTLAAADWASLVVPPPFPSYPSGHACVGGAARVVLEHEFGAAGFSVMLTSPAAPELAFSYHAWQDILDDVNDARIFGGIHFRFDQERGGELGHDVGEYVEANAPHAATATSPFPSLTE